MVPSTCSSCAKLTARLRQCQMQSGTLPSPSPPPPAPTSQINDHLLSAVLRSTVVVRRQTKRVTSPAAWRAPLDKRVTSPAARGAVAVNRVQSVSHCRLIDWLILFSLSATADWLTDWFCSVCQPLQIDWLIDSVQSVSHYRLTDWFCSGLIDSVQSVSQYRLIDSVQSATIDWLIDWPY